MSRLGHLQFNWSWALYTQLEGLYCMKDCILFLQKRIYGFRKLLRSTCRKTDFSKWFFDTLIEQGDIFFSPLKNYAHIFHLILFGCNKIIRISPDDWSWHLRTGGSMWKDLMGDRTDWGHLSKTLWLTGPDPDRRGFIMYGVRQERQRFWDRTLPDPPSSIVVVRLFIVAQNRLVDLHSVLVSRVT